MELDSNSLRMFCAAMDAQSFSAAAKNLGISQPSVSQMIARLEDKVGNRLFERIGHTVAPTRLARELYQFSGSWLQQLDQFFDTMASDHKAPTGKVRFAKPESFLWTVNYDAILRRLHTLKDLQIDIDIATNEQIVDGVLSDKYDFGFIVGEKLSSDLRFERFSEEQYVAVRAKSLKHYDLPTFEKSSTVRMITYPGWEQYFKMWASHHGLGKKSQSWTLLPVVNVGHLAGALRAVLSGTAFGVFPLQCVAKELADKDLVILDPEPSLASAPVYLIKRRGYVPPSRVTMVLQTLKDANR